MEFHQHFSTIDTHTAGEPLRIIISGVPDIKGNTMLEKRQYFTENLDHIRQILMYEPRGHHGMYGCIVTPPVSEKAEFGVLFMHNEGLSTMCGHGIIAVVTALVETGRLHISPEKETILIDSPAGLITAKVYFENNEVQSVAFLNVPSFVYKKNLVLTVGNRECQIDVAYGGAFYAIVTASDFSLSLNIEQLPMIQKTAKQIKEAIEDKLMVQHPLEDGISGIYGVIFTDKAHRPNSDLRSVTVFADQQIDRSPCGTGTSALLASLYESGRLAENDLFVNESIVGSQLSGKCVGKTMIKDYQAIITEINGRAFVTGLHQFFVDPSDPLADGFLLK
ncbi:proline racemase [Heyndrickxia shackletonii]|uniref:Proline racemase n=1 Tax=Heyndrickxia shackletonii TaxID=157838 RepID=A0A0Q3WWD0_9BACI|nr:proline racemase family protein [Heyndrickxia shackletonii]KQL52883.1 proline racemase [Heyndrickxia shackletonii]NEZ00345.1 proline racemase family protein [Heyndrickxia shackletonii]